MSKNKEYINSAGLRIDGRRPLEVRPISAKFGTMTSCDGSCILEHGNAKVCASVFGPQECLNKQEAKYDEALLICEVSIAAFSSEYRSNPQHRRRVAEDIATIIEQVTRSIVMLSQYPGSQIHIYIEVLQQNGSERATCINAACLALMNAGIAMRDTVCSINAGIIDDKFIVDLTSEEMRSQCPMVSLAVTSHDVNNIVWLETSSRSTPESMGVLIQGAQECIENQVWKTMKGVIEDYARETFKD
ncbi:unnamed protein product [Phytomonas sp. Hart1]|nr:unnamed protein product [Phytomonas sp. Hart1]|eukprot:CCW66875.1 unnamed protein product [Phytomonas sp. isolate Hart1]